MQMRPRVAIFEKPLLFFKLIVPLHDAMAMSAYKFVSCINDADEKQFANANIEASQYFIYLLSDYRGQSLL